MKTVCCLAVLWLQLPPAQSVLEEAGPPLGPPVVDLTRSAMEELREQAQPEAGDLTVLDALPPNSSEVTEPAWLDGVSDLTVEGLPAPILELRAFGSCKSNSQWRLRSDAQPPRWATVPAGELQLRVMTPPRITVDHVELTFDGRPLDAKIQDLGDEAIVRLPCPSVGRHVLQARYLVEDRWSVISGALRFEVRRPRRPAIEAVGEESGPLLPAGPTISIGSARLRVRLSHVEPQGEVFAYLDGRLIHRTTLDNACCLTVPLREHAVAGKHSLTIRSNACGGPCALASEASKAVQIHYRGLQQDRLLFHTTPTDAVLLDSAEPASGGQGNGAPESKSPPVPKPEPPPSAAGPAVGMSSGPSLNSRALLSAAALTVGRLVFDDTDGAGGDEDAEDRVDAAGTEGGETDAGAGGQTGDCPGTSGLADTAQSAPAPLDCTSEKALPEASSYELQSTFAATRAAIDASERRQDELRKLLALQEANEARLEGMKRLLCEQSKLEAQLRAASAAASQSVASQWGPPPKTEVQRLRDEALSQLARQAMLPRSEPCLTAKRTASEPSRKCSITFNMPANFPRTGFGPRGQSFDREGLLIYEGMTLEVDYNTGHYTLFFQTSAPPAPAVLRLQMKFRTEAGAWQTLTMPPVCISPALRDCHAPLPQELEGTSHLLRHSAGIAELKRSGFVHFGYGVSDGPTVRVGLGG